MFLARVPRLLGMFLFPRILQYYTGKNYQAVKRVNMVKLPKNDVDKGKEVPDHVLLYRLSKQQYKHKTNIFGIDKFPSLRI